MISTRRVPAGVLLALGLPSAIGGAFWATLVLCVYHFAQWHFLAIPYLPVATVGTAVAFYVGFKNNAAYARFWEGRKLWGGIVNVSRSWSLQVMSWVEPNEIGTSKAPLQRELIYRQLAWINALRMQLRRTTRFTDKELARRMRPHRDALLALKGDWDAELSVFVPVDEVARVTRQANPAVQLLAGQSTALATLARADKLDANRHVAMQALLTEMTALQGKIERIKGTPLPRQYAEYGRVFTRVFLFLTPFGLLDVFSAHIAATNASADYIAALPVIAASSLITWVFATMEMVGDDSEDPFERSINDVPMSALCRIIERDLREVLGESDVPPPVEPIRNVLY